VSAAALSEVGKMTMYLGLKRSTRDRLALLIVGTSGSQPVAGGKHLVDYTSAHMAEGHQKSC
jgi:putative NADH-flavin reductase